MCGRRLDTRFGKVEDHRKLITLPMIISLLPTSRNYCNLHAAPPPKMEKDLIPIIRTMVTPSRRSFLEGIPTARLNPPLIEARKCLNLFRSFVTQSLIR